MRATATTMSSARQTVYNPVKGAQAGTIQDPARSGTAVHAAPDPIAALRMPRKAAPVLPPLPIIGNSPSSVASAKVSSSAAAILPKNDEASAGKTGHAIARVELTAAPVLPAPIITATELGVAKGSPTAKGSHAPASGASPVVAGKKPGGATMNTADSASESEAEAPSTADKAHAIEKGLAHKSDSGNLEKAKPKSTSSPAATDFSFKRAPRKPVTNRGASAAVDKEATTLTKVYPQEESKPSIQLTSAAVSSNLQPSAAEDSAVAMADASPPSAQSPKCPEVNMKQNGHRAARELQQKPAQVPEFTAEPMQQSSDELASKPEQQVSARPLIEGIVNKTSDVILDSQDSRALPPLEDTARQTVSKRDAQDTIQPSDVVPHEPLDTARKSPPAVSAAPSLAESEIDVDTHSHPATEPAIGTATIQSLREPTAPAVPRYRNPTQRQSLPALSTSSGQAYGTSSDNQIDEEESEPASIHARINSMKRSSDPELPATSEAVRPGSFRWQVSTHTTMPNGSRGAGQVVEESCQPREQLRGFWEEQSPSSEKRSNGFIRHSSSTGNDGKKWSVKLSQPLANGKLIDLSYFKEKSVATLVLPPPTFDINIGDAYYSLTELQDMSGDDGIDPSQKEMYLNDDVFQEAFGFDKASFGSKPKWRQVILKKKVNLF